MEIEDFVWSDGTVRTLDSSFPVLLTRPGGSTIDPVRTAVAESPAGSLYFLVWHDGKSNGAELIVNAEIDRETISFGTVNTLTTVDGDQYSFTRSNGCGCGTMLRRWTPWPTARKLALSRASAT